MIEDLIFLEDASFVNSPASQSLSEICRGSSKSTFYFLGRNLFIIIITIIFIIFFIIIIIIIGRSLRILRMPWFEHWFWRDWITAMDSSVGHQGVSLARLSRVLRAAARLVLLLPRTAAPAVLKTRFVPCCTGWMFLRGFFQAVLARPSVSSWVGSALPGPLLHTGQLHRRMHTSPFGCHGHVVCA